MTVSKEISPWVLEHHSVIPEGGHILDLACGGGRHSRFLQDKGYKLTAVDIDLNAIRDADLSGVNLVQADLENAPWPFGSDLFDGIIVVNYLWRPQFQKLMTTLKANGVLIFDTFSLGNEKYGRPKNPDFLLKPGELKSAFSDLECLDFFEGFVENPGPAMRQSIVARKIN